MRRTVSLTILFTFCLISTSMGFINVSTESISFGTQLSTAGYISSPDHIEINFDKEPFNTWMEIYTGNASSHGLHGLRERNQNKYGFYGGLIATDTIKGGNFSRIELEWNLNDNEWYELKDKGDDNWNASVGQLPTCMQLSESLLGGTTAKIYIRGFFGKNGSAIEQGDYSTVINLDFWSDQPQPSAVVEKSAKTIGTAGGTVTLANTASIEIPRGALDKDTKITIEKLDPEHSDFAKFTSPSRASGKKPQALYRFSPPGIKFKKPVEIRLFFGDYTYTRNYKIFHRDEFFDEWDLIGGHQGESGGNVYVAANIQSFSIYAVYAVENLKASDFRPKNKIVTPHGSEPEAKFRGLSEQDTKIRIFDITGRPVRTLDKDPYVWDAKDENGRTVESGIYIYQFDAEIEGDTELVSGIIAVAK